MKHQHDKSPRAQILYLLATNGMMTVDEIVENSTLESKQARDNANAAKKEGLVTTRQDDVTGRLAYQITEAGSIWVGVRRSVPTGMQTIGENNGMSLEKPPEIDDDFQRPEDGPPVIDQEDSSNDAFPDETHQDAEQKTDVADGYVIASEGGCFGEIFETENHAIDRAIHECQRAGDRIDVFKLVLVGSARRQTVFVACGEQ